jgi:S-adenosylmethionine synthetase
MSTLIDPARIAEETGLTYTFSSESVSEGHPDKVCDTIADSILDAYLAQDPNARVACEVLVKANQVVLAGEITSTALVDHEAQVREAVRAIGYTDADQLFHADTLEIRSLLSSRRRRSRRASTPSPASPATRARATRGSCSATRPTRRRS